MSQKIKVMSHEEFLAEFEGFETDEDGLIVDIDFANGQAIVEAHNAKRLWTEYDDGHLENRIGFVNRCRYVVSPVPYAETNLIVVDPPL